MFHLHPRLNQDCIIVGRFDLSLLLLMNDENYPWFILVPQRDQISEIFQLSDKEQLQLNEESIHLSKVLSRVFEANKMNIAALGNVVPQLHIHHVVRYELDAAWPAPVWGCVPAKPYSKDSLDCVLSKISPELGLGFLPEKHF